MPRRLLIPTVVTFGLMGVIIWLAFGPRKKTLNTDFQNIAAAALHAGQVVIIVFLVMTLLLWLFSRRQGMIFLPFEDTAASQPPLGRAVSDSLIAELQRITRIHSDPLPAQTVQIRQGFRPHFTSAPWVAPAPEPISGALKEIGTVSYGGAKVSISELLDTVKRIWVTDTAGTIVKGSIHRYGNTVRLVANMEHGRLYRWADFGFHKSKRQHADEIQTWEVHRENTSRDQLPELIQDLAYRLANDISPDISAGTWLAFRYYTEALNAYRTYQITDQCEHLDAARGFALKLAKEEPKNRQLATLLYNIGLAYINEQQHSTARDLLMGADHQIVSVARSRARAQATDTKKRGRGKGRTFNLGSSMNINPRRTLLDTIGVAYRKHSQNIDQFIDSLRGKTLTGTSTDLLAPILDGREWRRMNVDDLREQCSVLVNLPTTLSYACFLGGDYETALALATRAINQNPTKLLAHCKRHVVVRLGSRTLRRRVVNPAVISRLQDQVCKQVASAHVGLANIHYARLNCDKEAFDDIGTALSLDHTQPYAYMRLGYLYMRTGDVVALDARKAEPNYLRALHTFRLALQVYVAVMHEPEPSDFHVALAGACARLRCKDDWLGELALAQRLAGGSSNYSKACFQAVAGNVAECCTYLEEALNDHEQAPSWAKADADFYYVGGSPKFQSLVGGCPPWTPGNLPWQPWTSATP